MSDPREPIQPDPAQEGDQASELEAWHFEGARHAQALVEHMVANKATAVLYNVEYQRHQYLVRVTLVDNVEEQPDQAHLPVTWPIGPDQEKG